MQKIQYSKDLDLSNFYKVDTRGFSLSFGIFFNPVTEEWFEKMIWDSDDDRVAYEAGDLYDMCIDDDVRILWLHARGVAMIGDKVEIYKGRKMLGEVKTIKGEWTFKPKGSHGWYDVDYWTFTDGTKCNKENCRYYKEVNQNEKA